jgi:CheY-specific phosphatase CheX
MNFRPETVWRVVFSSSVFIFMATPLPSADIQAYMAKHLAEVFETMLSMQAAPRADSEMPSGTDRISGTVGFAGETITGGVYLHLTAPFGKQVTATMLGMQLEEVTNDSEVNDVIGEVTNMLGGGLKSWLCDAGAPCSLTTPAVIRGQSFGITPSAGVEKILLGFECGTEHGLVEVHVKYR